MKYFLSLFLLVNVAHSATVTGYFFNTNNVSHINVPVNISFEPWPRNVIFTNLTLSIPSIATSTSTDGTGFWSVYLMGGYYTTYINNVPLTGVYIPFNDTNTYTINQAIAWIPNSSSSITNADLFIAGVSNLFWTSSLSNSLFAATTNAFPAKLTNTDLMFEGSTNLFWNTIRSNNLFSAVNSLIPSTNGFVTQSVTNGLQGTNINAGNISSGTLTDAILSSNIPLLTNASVQTFNGSNQLVGGVNFGGGIDVTADNTYDWFATRRPKTLKVANNITAAGFVGKNFLGGSGTHLWDIAGSDGVMNTVNNAENGFTSITFGPTVFWPSFYISTNANGSLINYNGMLSITNGIILPQLLVIPTNSMPLCSLTVTNWTLLNLHDGSGGNNVYLVATNVTSGGWLYSKLTGTITSTP